MESGTPTNKASSPYAITESLAHGNRSAIYRAIRTVDGCPVMLKVLDPQRSGPKDVERLKNEFEVGRVLASAAVLKPLALETYQGMPALSFEDFGGRSLSALLGKPLAIERFLPLAIAIANAVGEIHRAGFVHKDLKPDNILVGPASFEVKVIDLELASRLPRGQVAAAPPRLIEGSLPYLSPEQTGRMNRAIDQRSDLYALGVTFFQALTGKLPFEANDPLEWVHCHVARTPPSPAEVVPEVPETLAGVVLKMLAKTPEDRYQSAGGLIADLERCWACWQACGRIDPFPLGQDDVLDRLEFPHKLYGRERETAALLQAFDTVVGTGAPVLVMVSGYSGVGKSALVNALHRPIVEKRGYFCAGKFDQYQRDIPYATPAQAFRGLVRQILGESETRISEWRDALREALGPSGKLMVDLVPELELVIGPQPPVPELPPLEARYRFQMVFRQLIGVFARAAHPLVLFLDDLQWLDAGTLALLADVVTDPNVQHLLLVGAYRDNEVDSSHSLMRSLAAIRKQGGIVHDIILSPLSQNDVGKLVADALHDQPERVRPLSELIFEKTHGNPFFAIQFLTALAEEQLLGFDPGTRAFRWDLPRIHAKKYTDNVVDLMVGKLARLSAGTLDALKQFACLGNVADVATLALVLGQSAEAIHASLREAVHAGLILRLDDAYTFLHDRVQEAAYSLIPEDARAGTHLYIGNILCSSLTREAIAERIFEVVNQLNRGSELVASQEERERIAALDLLAGKRAKAATAFSCALRYLSAGAALLGENRWQRAYDLTFALELQRAECESSTGRPDAADERLAMLWEHAESIVDQAAVTCLRVDAYIALDRADRAVAVCLDYLRECGLDWSPHPTLAEVRQENERLWLRIGQRPIEDFVDLPLIHDPAARATIEVLSRLWPAAAFTDENLKCLLALRRVNLSLEHGNSDAAAVAYVTLGAFFGRYFDDYAMALRFGQVAVDLVERRGLDRYKAHVYIQFAIYIIPWARPLRTGQPWQRRGIDVAIRMGDLNAALYGSAALVTNMLACGEPLAEVEREAVTARELARKLRFGAAIDMIEPQLCLIRALRGLTKDFASFNDADFDEAQFEQHLETKSSFPFADCWYSILKLEGRLFAGDYASAMAASARAERHLWTSNWLIQCAELHFYAALAHAASCTEVLADERRPHRDALAAHHQQLAIWAKHCPENFEARTALVAAEIARIEDRDLEAQRLYEQAIRSARDHGFVHIEALANELSGRFYLGRGLDTNGVAHLRNARACYARWGADGKVTQLDLQYAQLIKPTQPANAATVTLRTDQLDLYAVTKASQTISGEIVLETLLRTLLTIVLEQGGAERARFVLHRDGRLSLEAEATLDTKGAVTTVLERAAVESSGRMPASVVNYALRTKQRVILNSDEGDASELARDNYFTTHRPKSVLCLPILRQAEVVGLLYLENDLLVGAFTPDRLAALELLATQAAISLENAQLLGEVRGALAAAAFLADAGAVLSESLDYEKTFARLGRLCVQGLADWCAIDIVEGQEIRRLAVAHRDPTKEPIVLEVQRRYPPRWDSPHPAIVALRTGEPVLTPELTDEFVRAICHNEEHQRLARALGLRTALSVPLIARGQTLGVLSLASGAAGRCYGRADLELAQDLARRAAVAIDNARLYQASQEEVRLRKTVEAQLVQAQKMESIGRLAGGIAHDFNNFLTVMSLGIELSLSELPEDHPVRPSLADVAEAAVSATGLTRQLLAFSRKQIIAPVVLDLNEVIRRIEKMILRLLRENIRLETMCAPDLASVGFDPGQVEQIVLNLAVNARDAMPNGGRLTIQTSNIHVDEEYARLHEDAQPGPHVLLQVSDTGEGMSADVRAQLFEPFFTTKEPGKGTGLGLAMVYGAVRQNNGRIEVYSEIGIGTTFKIYLPASAAAAAALTPSAGVSVNPAARAASILLVEDDKRVRTFATSVLARFGHTVHAFGDGEGALAALSTLSPTPELLITDVIMSGMNGGVLAERLVELLPTIRVLFVSGYPDNVIVHRGILKKGIEFLAKPFSIEQLTRRVNEVLGAK